VRELVDSGHQVWFKAARAQVSASMIRNYQAAGAVISKKVEDIFISADLIIKVKEPQLAECKMLRASQTLFTYLHLRPIASRRWRCWPQGQPPSPTRP